MPKHAPKRKRKPDPNATIWVFKVTLTTKPKIWRTIAIRSDQTLDDLHDVLFEAFDRFDEHLYSFHKYPLYDLRGKNREEVARSNIEYTSPILIEEADPFGERDIRDASKTRVSELELKPGSKFYYLFDFGDSWWHELTLEKTDEGIKHAYQYPFILEKHGISPPQYEYPEDN